MCLGRPTCRVLTAGFQANILRTQQCSGKCAIAKRAAYIRFLTEVLSQLHMRNLESEYSNCEEYRAIPMTTLYLKVMPRWHGIVSEMKHQVSKSDLCIWCGGHWRNTPLKTHHCQSISVSKAPKFPDFAISNGCCGNILCLALCGKEDQQVHA